MITKRLLPIVVLAIGGLVVFGCANQTQIPDKATEASNQTGSKNGSAGNAHDDAAESGSTLASNVPIPEHASQFVIPNPRQHVLSSGFPARSY
jgi:hypothetical protein